MIQIHIDDKKTFTSQLFIREAFDKYFLVEASITTGNTYTIDGRIQKKFYTESEYEELGKPELSRWESNKKLCFEIIKGNRMPLKFKIIFKLPDGETEKLVREAGGTLTSDDVQGLLLNIRFENDSLDCVTATSLKIFSMDKSVEEAFDRYMEKFIGINA